MKLDEIKVARVLKLAKNTESTDVRKEIGKIFKVKKTRRNEIYNEIFNSILKSKAKKPMKAFKVNGDKGTVELKNIDNVRTVEDLIDYAEIDTDIWLVKKFSANVWDGKWQVKAEFEKRKDKQLEQLLSELKEDIVNYSPKTNKISYTNYKNNELLLEIAIFDLHLGKLGHHEEVGTDYDMKIARRVFFDALYDIVEKAKKQGIISKILFPIGNDFLNIDNDLKTTTAGTPQDADSRFYKIFREGRQILVEAINYLKEIAPVDVLVVRGNHDSVSMFHLGDAIQCWFNNDKNVTIDNSPKTRKYYQYGENLVVYTHGDKEKADKLPLIAATEEPTKWASSKYREIRVGHLHHEVVKEFNGVKLRVVPSISGNDGYHFERGYTENIRSAQGFIFDFKNGLESIIYSRPVQK